MFLDDGRATCTTKVAARKMAEMICKYANIVAVIILSSVSISSGKQVIPFKLFTLKAN